MLLIDFRSIAKGTKLTLKIKTRQIVIFFPVYDTEHDFPKLAVVTIMLINQSIIHILNPKICFRLLLVCSSA